MANKWYGFLMEFTKGTTPCREHLVKRYSEEMLLEALKNKYIEECKNNKSNDIKYRITDLGKKVRDE
ncbi:MAG: hypothetical protein J1F11_06485 [Oscillospiraceae bacterium]|nr:hypothetical protein [Oscillospiraceae bacterium]